MSEPTRDEVELPALETDPELDGKVYWREVAREREDQLKAALAANREKDAQLASQDGVMEENTRLRSQLASLRASGGEKPENAWYRGWAAGYQYALDQVNCRTTFASTKYVAPPTLTREKE